MTSASAGPTDPPLRSVPPDGFTVPLPYVLSREVTHEFPHLPRPPADGLAAGLTVAWLGGSALVAGVATTLGTTAAVWAAGAAVCLAALAFVATVVARVSGGPLLAVSPWGLWVRTRPGPGQAIWLPWSAIESMRVRRLGRRAAFVIRPRDLPLGRIRLGAWTALTRGYHQLLFGRGFVVRISPADPWTRDVLEMALHYAHVHRGPPQDPHPPPTITPGGAQP